MAEIIPDKLLNFLKNGIKDVEDGYEYSSELNRILNSDDCQTALSSKEIEVLRDFADKVKKVGEITYYTEERVKNIESEIFGKRGVLGFLGVKVETKPQWPF
ncbi:MAG: hypothetical protein N2645_10245 [Clostridia bacterium]|nr:hypothetical protein [Clostridia bacterium]